MTTTDDGTDHDLPEVDAALVELGLVPAGARLRRLATGSTWAEGPVHLADPPRVRWSDIPGDRIMEHSLVSGETSVYATGVEFTNGRTLDAGGGVVQCSHGRRRVELDVGGEVTALVDSWNGVRLNSPNDVVVAPDGSVWFTDPPYGITVAREGHPGVREYDDCWVFRLDRATGALRPVVTDVHEPNGLAFSPDGSLLYVSDTQASSVPGGAHEIRVYDVDGARCKHGRTFAVVEPGVPDGFRVDDRGDVWTSAGDGVHVLSPAGELLGRIGVPEVVSNCCFGGPAGTDLFITATTGLYAVPTLVTDAARR